MRKVQMSQWQGFRQRFAATLLRIGMFWKRTVALFLVLCVVTHILESALAKSHHVLSGETSGVTWALFVAFLVATGHEIHMLLKR